MTNLSREKASGVSDYSSLVGDYKNPILQPWAAEVVKKKGELSLAGITFPSPSNTCWPEPVPYLFKHAAMEMLQLPDQIVMLFNENHEVRRVRLNEPHPAEVKPSWHGDAVGHYEGDTLVIDTVGIRTDRPFAMIDLFGTPYTDKLHVVERYRLVDHEDAKDAMQRGIKENRRAAGPYDPNYKDKYLQVLFTIEDEGAFTTPWTAVMIYLRERGEFPEAGLRRKHVFIPQQQECRLAPCGQTGFLSGDDGNEPRRQRRQSGISPGTKPRYHLPDPRRCIRSSKSSSQYPHRET